MPRLLAVHGYRSIRRLAVELGPVTVVTGANGAAKTNFSRAVRLLRAAARGDPPRRRAEDGGLDRVLWAGPRSGGARTPVSLMLGLATEEGERYLIDMGLPQPRDTMFGRDPEIKRELFFVGEAPRPSAMLAERRGGRLVLHGPDGPAAAPRLLHPRESMLTAAAGHPEAHALDRLRRALAGWRFYDALRADPAAPARGDGIAAWTPVLADDGADLAPAVQTIRESGGAAALDRAIQEAFPGARLEILAEEGRLRLAFAQPGLLRPLGAEELSDGTLRFLLLAAALLSPEPPELLVLDEPETSLFRELLPALAGLVLSASARTRILLVSHERALLDALLRDGADRVVHHELVREDGASRSAGSGPLDGPRWQWGER